MGERIDEMIKQLEAIKLRKFSDIETILIGYFVYWSLVLSLNADSFEFYPVYDDLSKITSQETLVLIMSVTAILMTIGCVLRNRILRLTMLAWSMGIWLVIGMSIFQVDSVNMRGSVVILACASGYQFYKIMNGRGRTTHDRIGK